jgi:protein TonB
MDMQQTRRFLIVAFAISLLIHAIAMLFVRWPTPPREEIRVVHLTRMPPIRIARLPTPPPPTPTPAPTPAATHAPAAPRRPHRKPSPVGIGAGAHPTPAPPSPTPPPTPRASATPPDCRTADTPVTIAVSPPPPELPADARPATGGIARVQVNVRVDGTIAGATLAQSSGTPALDAIAIAMAQGARYTPATHRCKAVAAAYLFSVKFAPW